MKVIFKSELLILVPETDAERQGLGTWKSANQGHVLYAGANAGVGQPLVDLGPREFACNVPINVISSNPDPSIRLISNFATTPFRLDGLDYASVEGFWQGLKYDEESERRRVAGLTGLAARAAGLERRYGATITYAGRQVPVGAWDHWQLMERANWAKFTQNDDARLALLATAGRPLIHRTRRDSREIPGAIMSEIWMRIRKRLAAGQGQPKAVGVPEDNRVLFFKRDREQFGFLSNFHLAPIRIGDEVWPTVEHYYQAQKSLCPDYRQAIRQAATPGEAKRLAATPGPELPPDTLSWFVRHGTAPRPDWAEVKLAVMREAVAAKFTWSAELAAALRATGTAELVEDSLSDAFWGMGRDGTGQNWLGRILMEVREALGDADAGEDEE